LKEKIQKQRKLACQVVQSLKELGFFSVVAGGAPRDWFFNRPAKDIDIFVQENPQKDLTTETINKIFQKTGWDLRSKLFEQYSDLTKEGQAAEMTKDYIKANLEVTKVSLGDPGFTRKKFIVCTFILENEEIQLIFRDFQYDSISLIKNFGCTISETFLSEDDKIVCSECFKESLNSGVILYFEDSGYILKLQNKFPNWRFRKDVSYF